MEKTSQEKYRGELIAKYEQRAWECLALYNYYGRQYAEIEKQVTDIENKKKEAEEKIRATEGSGKLTVEKRNMIKGLKKDCEQYEGRIKGVAELVKKFFEKSAAYREEGVRILEQIEDFKAFNLKTPQEIAKAKVEQEPDIPDEAKG